MPVTDNYALRYPGPYDTVNATSWQNLATDVDTALSTVDAKKNAANQPPSARVKNNSSQLLTASTPATITFSTEDWDIGGLANLGVNNDRLTLGTGIWIVSAGVRFFGMTVVTECEVNVTFNGANYCQHRIGGIYNGAIPLIQVVGLVVCTAATDYVGFVAAWIGTGGPATALAGWLQATKIRNYP